MKKSLFFLTLVVTSGFVFSQDDTLASAQNYKEIVIQGQKKKNKDKTALQLQASTDKLLSTTPGITLIKRGNFALEPTIRGLNAGQINTTIDGMQMFGACTDRMDPISSYIEPTNIEKIQLSTNLDEGQTGSDNGGGIKFALMKTHWDTMMQ